MAVRARIVSLDGVELPLADLADVIRSERDGNRLKDLETLSALEETLRRREAGEH